MASPQDSLLFDLMELYQLRALEDYIEAFETIANQISLIEEFKVYYFVTGLKEELASILKMYNPCKLQEAIYLAKFYDKFTIKIVEISEDDVDDNCMQSSFSLFAGNHNVVIHGKSNEEAVDLMPEINMLDKARQYVNIHADFVISSNNEIDMDSAQIKDNMENEDPLEVKDVISQVSDECGYSKRVDDRDFQGDAVCNSQTEMNVILVSSDQKTRVMDQLTGLKIDGSILIFTYERITGEEIKMQLTHEGFSNLSLSSDKELNFGGNALNGLLKNVSSGVLLNKFSGEVKIMTRLVSINILLLMRASGFLFGSGDDASLFLAIDVKEKIRELPYCFEHWLYFQEEVFKPNLGYDNKMDGRDLEENEENYLNVFPDKANFQFEVSRGDHWNQMKYKFLGKLIILIWGWYYKEIWKFFREIVQDLIMITTQNSLFCAHPENWIVEWKIAWL